MTWADRIICQLVLKECGEPAESNAMFRTAAAILAKKTAIVAITGVTVIGGATFALANVGGSVEETPSTTSQIATQDECVAASGVWDDAAKTCALDNPEPAECDPATETCPDPAPVECDPATETCPDPAPVECDPATETCPDPAPVECDPATETCPESETEEDGGEDAVHPENHGKYVSEAAKACKQAPAEGETTYKNHGECVRAVAQGQEGKPAHDDDAAEAETTESETPVVTETVVEEPAPAPKAVAPAPKPAKEKPAAAQGGGRGGGKGKKG